MSASASSTEPRMVEIKRRLDEINDLCKKLISHPNHGVENVCQDVVAIHGIFSDCLLSDLQKIMIDLLETRHPPTAYTNPSEKPGYAFLSETRIKAKQLNLIISSYTSKEKEKEEDTFEYETKPEPMSKKHKK